MEEVKIPSTIQDVIMARVDSLPQKVKDLLQIGSVIEREFSYELVKRVTALDDKELFTGFSLLKDAELLYERGIFPQSTYIFKHALTREVIYDSLLAKKKKTLHEEIGSAIEALYKDNLGEHYEVLAEHFIKNENYEKGAGYSRLAARKAQKAASFKDAIIHAEKRTSCLERLPRTEDVEKNIIDSRLTLGLYHIQGSNYNEAKEAIDPIFDSVVKHGDKKRRSQIYTILGTHSWGQEDYPKAFQYLEEALKIAEESKDFTTLWVASHWMGHALAENCEFEKALIYLERDLQISTFANILWSISIMKSCLAMTVYCEQGKVDLAYKTSDEGLKLAEESGDTFSKAEAYTSCGYSSFFKGFLDRAETYLMQGIGFSERINYSTMTMAACIQLGITYFEQGEYQKSQEYYNRYISACEKRKIWPSRGIHFGKIHLAGARVKNNETAINLDILYEGAKHNKVKSMEGYMAARIGEILMNIDDNHIIGSEHWIQKAIEADQRNRMIFHLGQDYAFYAELFKRKGDRSKAQENLGKAIEILKECGADGWVEKYEKELASL